MTKNQLKCPKCNSNLIGKGYSQHQTLIEHVCNPNRTPSLKQEYRCPNNCYSKHVFWDSFGDVYIGYYWWQKILMKFNYYGFKMINAPNIRNNN